MGLSVSLLRLNKVTFTYIYSVYRERSRVLRVVAWCFRWHWQERWFSGSLILATRRCHSHILATVTTTSLVAVHLHQSSTRHFLAFWRRFFSLSSACVRPLLTRPPARHRAILRHMPSLQPRSLQHTCLPSSTVLRHRVHCATLTSLSSAMLGSGRWVVRQSSVDTGPWCLVMPDMLVSRHGLLHSYPQA